MYVTHVCVYVCMYVCLYACMYAMYVIYVCNVYMYVRIVMQRGVMWRDVMTCIDMCCNAM